MRKKQKGSVLVLTLVLMVMLLFLAGVLLQLTLLNYMHITKSSESEKAFWIAKAGLSEAKYYVIKNWFDPDLIVSLCKQMVSGKNFGTNSDGSVSGSYKVGISPINGPGVHEIVIASEGITVPIEEYKRLDEYEEDVRKAGYRTALILRLRMDTPTDYLFFWNGDSGMTMDSNWIIGPVYANGSFYIAVGKDALAAGPAVVNHCYYMKQEVLKGPTVHCNGTFWVPAPFDGDVRIGEGKVKWGPPSWTGIPTDEHSFTHNTDSNALPGSFQYNDAIVTNNNYYYPNFNYYAAVPTHITPNITFPVEQLDGKTRNLLQDKFHGAYNIYCPTKDEVYKVFYRYIDENFYIRNTISTSIPGAKITGFYNMAAKRKTPFPFINHGEEVVGFIEYGQPGGTYPNVLNPAFSYYFSRYNPFSYAYAKDLYVGGMHVSSDDYQVASGDGGWWTNPNIIFKPGFNSVVGTPIKANKCRIIYGTNDTTNYHPDAQFSPVNWDIQGGTVVMKSSILSEPPLDAEYGYGKRYQTASFMDPGSMSVTAINKYEYCPGGFFGPGYGSRARHWLSKSPGPDFGTGWGERITSGPIIVTGPKDSGGGDMTSEWGKPWDINATGWDGRWSGWEGGIPPINTAQYEPHSGLIAAGGGAEIVMRPMIRNNVYGANSGEEHGGSHMGACYWYGAPELGVNSGASTYGNPAGTHYAPNIASGDPEPYVNFFRTGTTVGSNLGKKAAFDVETGTEVAWWQGDKWTDAGDSVFSNFGIAGIGIPYLGKGATNLYAWEVSWHNRGGGNSETDWGSIQFINSDPQAAGITNVCITYTSKRKEIIAVSGSITNPYKALCTDQWVDLVTLDLTMLDEDNWPKYGLIFSEVPLFVTGIPKKKITIVSTKDVYLGNINYGYFNSVGIWIPSTYTMGDERANPVAVISGGQVYISFQQNTNRDLWPMSKIVSSGTTNYVARFLNKVIFYSQTDNLYYCDGCPGQRSLIYGSAVLGRKSGLVAGQNDAYHTKNVLDSDNTRLPISRFSNFGMGGGSGLFGSYSGRSYEESFRYNLPTCIPKTVKSMDYAEGNIGNIETLLKDLATLLETLDETDPQVQRKGLFMIEDSKWEEIGNLILAD